MRAITLTQPWAGLVASGIKLVENRNRPIIGSGLFGQQVAIHASREIDESVYNRIAEIAPDVFSRAPLGERVVPCKRDWYRLSRITGAVIAVATVDRRIMGDQVVACAIWEADGSEAQLGDQQRWFFGPIGYVLRDMREVRDPVPCRGMLGCWKLPDDVERAVRARLPCDAGGTHVRIGHDIQCSKCLAELRP